MATFWLLQFIESIRLHFFRGVTTLNLFDCYNVKRQTSNAKERINRRFSSKNRKYSSLWNTAHKFFNSMACRTMNIFAEESNTSLPWLTAWLSALKSSVCIPVFLIYPCYPPWKHIKESLLHTLISAQAANKCHDLPIIRNFRTVSLTQFVFAQSFRDCLRTSFFFTCCHYPFCMTRNIIDLRSIVDYMC